MPPSVLAALSQSLAIKERKPPPPGGFKSKSGWSQQGVVEGALKILQKPQRMTGFQSGRVTFEWRLPQDCPKGPRNTLPRSLLQIPTVYPLHAAIARPPKEASYVEEHLAMRREFPSSSGKWRRTGPKGFTPLPPFEPWGQSTYLGRCAHRAGSDLKWLSRTEINRWPPEIEILLEVQGERWARRRKTPGRHDLQFEITDWLGFNFIVFKKSILSGKIEEGGGFLGFKDKENLTKDSVLSTFCFHGLSRTDFGTFF